MVIMSSLRPIFFLLFWVLFVCKSLNLACNLEFYCYNDQFETYFFLGKNKLWF